MLTNNRTKPISSIYLKNVFNTAVKIVVGKILVVNSPDCICIGFLKVSHHIFKLFKQNANNTEITYSEKGKFNLGLRGTTGKAAGNTLLT